MVCTNVKFALKNLEINDNGKNATILQLGKFTQVKLVLAAVNEIAVRAIHFPGRVVPDVAVVKRQIDEI